MLRLVCTRPTNIEELGRVDDKKCFAIPSRACQLVFFLILTSHHTPCNRSRVLRRDRSAFCQLNPASEVASLIQEFEGKLTRSVDDNAQLRDFCAHLEGLLAVHQEKSGRENPPAFVVDTCIGGFVPSPAGACGSRLSKAAGGNGKHSTNPFAACREPFGDRRMRLSFPGSVQD